MIDSDVILRKVAHQSAQAYALLRFKVPKLVVPLSCVIDYYSYVFEVQTAPLLTLDSLVYGSGDNGLLYKNDDFEAE